MRRAALLLGVLGTVAGFALGATPAQAQATRTWVSGVGDDVNPCSRTAPCKTFAGAISKTAAGGIINCIDPGGFGAVTITKSITIDCEGTFAGILAVGTNAININAAGIIVTLRNLSIEGAGTGLIGVNFINGAVLNIENCKIFGFKAGSAFGISFAPSAGAELYVTDTSIFDNGTGVRVAGVVGVNAILNRVQLINNTVGLLVDGTAGGAKNVTLRDSEVAGNAGNGITSTSTVGAVRVILSNVTVAHNAGIGVNSNGTASLVFIGGSTINSNVTGVSITASGQMQSFKNNLIAGNSTDGTPIAAFPGPGGTPLQ